MEMCGLFIAAVPVENFVYHTTKFPVQDKIFFLVQFGDADERIEMAGPKNFQFEFFANVSLPLSKESLHKSKKFKKRSRMTR